MNDFILVYILPEFSAGRLAENFFIPSEMKVCDSEGLVEGGGVWVHYADILPYGGTSRDAATCGKPHIEPARRRCGGGTVTSPPGLGEVP